MKTKLFTVLISTLVLLLLIPQARADVEPFTINYELNTYIETRIVVSYSFTQNVSGADAWSAGQSVWSVNIDPLVSSFTTSAADKFTWNLIVNYGVIVEQTVTIAIFSGNEAVDTITLDVKTDRLIFNFDVTVTSQPKYPTAEELADKSIEVLRNELADLVAQMRYQNERSSANLTIQWLIIGFFVIMFVAQQMIPLIYKKREKQ